MAKKLGKRPSERASSLSRPQRIQEVLARRLIDLHARQARPVFEFTPESWATLATFLYGLAEDLHCGSGVWRSLEAANQRLFGTPLPFILSPGATLPPDQIAPERLRYYLWIVFDAMLPESQVQPDHPELLAFTDAAAQVLSAELRGMPRTSALKARLERPLVEAWDAKGKLVALGNESFLFQPMMMEHLAIQRESATTWDNPATIDAMDDFLTRERTAWSALSVLDLLVEIIDPTDRQRADLLAWPDRQTAPFEILAASRDRMRLRHVVNSREFVVRLDLAMNLPSFTPGQYVMGTIVPWDGEWSWSGIQRHLPTVTPTQVATIEQESRQNPSLFYRYHPDNIARAEEINREMLEAFRRRHGKDWHVFEDASALADDWQRSARDKFATLDPTERRSFLKKHHLTEATYRVNIPREILEMPGRIGVYQHPVEGLEIQGNFGPILSGLAKRGVNLSSEESAGIEAFVRSEGISPEFVRRVVTEHGDESILAVFGLDQPRHDYALEFLLRRHKRVFYGRRFPAIIVV